MNGIITLNVATGVTTTYDTPLGAAEKLIKTGGGTAVLSVATTDFKGNVDIQEGELKLTDANAAGSGKNKIEVTGDAATLHLNIPRPNNAAQLTMFFSGHDVTIRGKGVGEKGAFRYTATSGGYVDDSMLESLSLSGDAYIAIPSRFGIGSKLNLNGHTLTRIDGGDNWMFYNPNLEVNHGTISNKTGQITLQNTPKFSDPEKTVISMAGGTLTAWSMAPALTCNLVFCGGELEAGSGDKLSQNIFTGTIALERDLNAQTRKGKLLQFTGNMIGNGHKLNVYGSGTNYFNCTTDEKIRLQVNDTANIAFTSNIVRKLIEMRGVSYVRPGCYTLDAGRLELSEIIRMANSGSDKKGSFFQTGGEMQVKGDTMLGESDKTYGAFVMSGCNNVFNNVISLAAGNSGALGAFWQYGGKNKCTSYLRLARAGRGFFGVWNGGVFDCYNDKYENAERVKLGEENYGNCVLSIDGNGSVLETGNVVIGAGGIVSTNYIVVSNGGTLKARRFYRTETTGEGAYSEVYVNGGTIMPTWWSGWNHVDYNQPNFGNRSPNHWVIGPKGMVIDTRDVRGDNAEHKIPDDNKVSRWPHVLEDPEGQGIASIELPTDDADFMKEQYGAPAFIDIEGPEGSRGAIAMAEIDPKTKVLKGVVVVAEGSNYDETTHIFVHSATNKDYRFECKYKLTGARTPGSLIKRGDGAVSFKFDNTYTGGTIVEEGRIELVQGKGFPGNTPLDVRAGAKFENTGYPLTVSWLGCGGGTINTSGLSITGGIKISPAVFFAEESSLLVNGGVNFAEGCKVVVDDMASLHDYCLRKAKVLLTARSGITGTVPETSIVDSYGTRWYLYKTGNSIKFGPVRGLRVIVK